jgi:hypothetical protein
MFGNTLTPSPAFSVEVEIEGEWRMTVKILGCRPKDLSLLPPDVVALMPEYGEGTQEAACCKCGCDIVLGPRQALAYDLTPDEYLVCCIVCSTIISIMYSPDGNIGVQHLGGE